MKALPGERIARERAEGARDVLGQVASRIALQGAQEHAGHRHRMRFRLQFLAVGDQDRRRLGAVAVLGDVVYRVGQEAARAACRVVQGADQAGVGLEQLVVRVQDQGRRQMHHVARRHEVLGAFIDLGAEAADQVLVDVAHRAVRDRRRVQVDLGKVLANLEQQPGLVEAVQCC